MLFYTQANASNLVSESYLTIQAEIPADGNEWKVSATTESKRTVFATGDEVYYCMNSVLEIDFDHYYKIEFYKGDLLVWENQDSTPRTGWGTYSDYYTANVSTEAGDYTFKFFYSYDGNLWILDDEITFTVLEKTTLIIPYFIGANEGCNDILRIDNLSNSKNEFDLILYSGGAEVYNQPYLLEPFESMEINIQSIASASYGEVVCLKESVNVFLNYACEALDCETLDCEILDINNKIGGTAENLCFYFPSETQDINFMAIGNSGPDIANIEMISMSEGSEQGSITLTLNPKTAYFFNLPDYFEMTDVQKIFVFSEGGLLSGFSLYSDSALTNTQSSPASKAIN